MSKLQTDAQVLIAVPTMGSVHPILVSRLLQWSRDFPKGQLHFYFTFKVAPVDRARNQVVRFFLSQKFTHLLFIDSDTIPPVDALDRLLSHDKDVITGLTPILSYEKDNGNWQVYDNAFSFVERNAETGEATTHVLGRNTGVQPVYRCGASCLMIKRHVFEKISRPFFEFITNEENTEHVRSEDINFCDKVRDAGMEVYADTDVVCQHYKDIML